MLTTTNKTKFGRVRKLLVLPVTLLVIVTMSISTIESKANAIVTPTAGPQQPNNPFPAPQPEKPFTKNDTTPTPVKAKERAEKIKAENDAQNNNSITLTADTIVIRRKGEKKELPTNVLYYINERLATSDEVSKLKPGQIKSVTVWKGDEAVKRYGEAGSNGVIEIITKLVL